MSEHILAYQFDKEVNGSKYLTQKGKVVLFNRQQADRLRERSGDLTGKFVEYNDTFPTVVFNEF